MTLEKIDSSDIEAILTRNKTPQKRKEITVREETEFSKSIEQFKTFENRDLTMIENSPKSTNPVKQIVNLI
jgi:hypothetical protein